MGYTPWDPNKWDNYAATNVNNKATVHDVYTSRSINNLLDPKGVTMRESCDSVLNPNSTAVIIGLDVTGSMQAVLDSMARTGLRTTADEIYNRKPITDPHLMFMGIGDVAAGDSAPLQVTQFEADIRIAEQLQKLYLEGGGGGNGSESYALAWYFAAMHTRIDCFEKRQRKGFLFTVGNDGPTPRLTKREINSVMGYLPERDLLSEELLAMASRQYEVFHLMVDDSGRHPEPEKNQWRLLLGENAILLSDHTKMGEVIVSIMQARAGVATQSIIDSWDGTTGLVVSKAISALTHVNKSNNGLVTF